MVEGETGIADECHGLFESLDDIGRDDDLGQSSPLQCALGVWAVPVEGGGDHRQELLARVDEGLDLSNRGLEAGRVAKEAPRLEGFRSLR